MNRAASSSAAGAVGKRGPHGARRRQSTVSPAQRRDLSEGGENDPLLDAEAAGDDQTKALPDRCATEIIYPLVHTVRNDVKNTIDAYLDWHELTSLELNYSIVRPLALKYSRFRQLSILFILLLNRIQFQRDAERDVAMQAVNQTRAALCELLAIKLLRTFAHDGFELVTALAFPFSPFQAADESTTADELVPDYEQTTSAMELAILSKAKKFLKSPLAQRCIMGIYEGRVVLSYKAQHAIVDDSYKKRPLGIYDPTKAPFLDHYRLRVPLVRSRIEFVNFCLLLLFYVWCLSQKGEMHWTTAETIFTIWLFGFALDEAAQLQEHGVGIYVTSLYNMLDFTFCIVSFVWLGIRISSLSRFDVDRANLSFDTLALGAILLCPRVASALIQDNVILLALKAMLADFAFFMGLAGVCFSGFLYTFWSLSDRSEWTASKIIWIMLKVWFGNSYVGFDKAESFSPIFGPPLMVFFAVMANSLLLTILISLLSNTFSVVSANAAEEAFYQFTCKTFAGISTDALFSYVPPLNLLAVLIVMPLSFVLSPRWLHKVNVVLLRLTSWPILLLIRLCAQRRSFSQLLGLDEATTERATHFISWLPLPRSGKNGDKDIVEAVFARARTSCMDESGWEQWAEEAVAAKKAAKEQDDKDHVAWQDGQTRHLPQTPRKASEGGKGYGATHPAKPLLASTCQGDGPTPPPSAYASASTASNNATDAAVPTKPMPSSSALANTSKANVTAPYQSSSSSSPSSAATAAAAGQKDMPRSRTYDVGESMQHHRRHGSSALGTLSSPLARIYGARTRTISDQHAGHHRSTASSHTNRAEQAGNLDGTEDDAAGPGTRELIISLMEKIDRQEKAQQRLEDLLVKIAGDRVDL